MSFPEEETLRYCAQLWDNGGKDCRRSGSETRGELEPEPGSIAGLPSFPPILRLKVSFSLVQPTSPLTLRLYAEQSGHPGIPIGTRQIPVPPASQSGSFYRQSSLSSPLNVSRADIPCILENNVGETAQSMQPVTLYISINIAPPKLHNNPSSMQTEDKVSLREETIIPGHTQFPAPGHFSPLSHSQPVEAGNNKPQSCEVASPATTNNLPLDLRRAGVAMERIDRSNTCQGVVLRIKWVMDTLGPVAEVRVIPFDVSG